MNGEHVVSRYFLCGIVLIFPLKALCVHPAGNQWCNSVNDKNKSINNKDSETKKREKWNYCGSLSSSRPSGEGSHLSAHTIMLSGTLYQFKKKLIIGRKPGATPGSDLSDILYGWQLDPKRKCIYRKHMRHIVTGVRSNKRTRTSSQTTVRKSDGYERHSGN